MDGILVKVFVKFLEQQRPDQGIWSILKRKGWMHVHSVSRFLCFYCRTRTGCGAQDSCHSPGMSQRPCVMSPRCPVALLLSDVPGTPQSASV